MVELLLLYHATLSVSEAEARVRAVLHASYPDLGQHAGEQEAPLEEMFRFNLTDDLARVVKMIEEEDRKEWERQEASLRETELLEEELNWTVVTKKVKKKKEKVEMEAVLGRMGNEAASRKSEGNVGPNREAWKKQK